MSDEDLEKMEAALREAFAGYHFEISFFPSGGSICIEGCEECGTAPGMTFSGWRTQARTGPRTLSKAIEEALIKLRDVEGKSDE